MLLGGVGGLLRRRASTNAAAENAIRPIGCKNGIFADTPSGTRDSNIFYSLIESPKARGQEPFECLNHILKELSADTVGKPGQLFPTV